jgi:Undecaprenyl-phosphate galactose phosphotransferase WbaP
MHPAVPNPPFRRGLAFLAGVGFAAVPTVGPYLAVVGAIGGGVRLQRADRWWWAAALLLGLPWLVTGHVWAGAGATGQALAVWLIFRSASAVRGSLRDQPYSKELGAGLLIGLMGAIALGLDRAGEWRLETARSVFDLVAWTGNPSLFAHAMLVLAALLAVILPSPRGRVLALGLGAGAVVVSGVQEAVLAWLLMAIGLRFVGRRGARGTATTEWLLIGVMAVVATGLTTTLGTGRTGFRVDLTEAGSVSNLFRGVEAPTGDWWHPLEVTFDGAPGTVGGEPRMIYDVTKVGADPFARLQQIVRLEPGRGYVLSVAWRGDTEARPGLDGWGRVDAEASASNVAATWADGAWRVAATGALTVVEADAQELGDGWWRGHVAFRYEGEAPLVWYVGAVPDRRSVVGATTSFAELQLVAGTQPTPYVALPPDRGLADLRTTRFPLWAAALEAVAVRPWLGWGPAGFATADAALDPSGARQRPFAAHAHALLLDVWVERGAVGVVGLLLFAGLLALRSVQQRDRAMAVVLLGVLVLNLFETTFFNGAIVYPLAAVLGWRAVGHRAAARAQTGVGSAAAVRLALATGDVAVAAGAFSVAIAATAGGLQTALGGLWTPTLGYATLLWPAFAAAAGLYPGYGRPLHDELARGVRAAAVAGVTLAALALAIPELVPLPTRTLLLAAALAVLAAPAVRIAVKLTLRAARLWGRPVAILGTGPGAARVVRYLLDHPAIGLRPVAAFGESDWDVAALPVTGRLESAWRALPGLGVRHAIVTPEAARAVGYDEVLRRAERSLRFVQFVPDLHGIPASSVVAAPLGTSLALEVRNQLASRTNRAAKRAFDLVGALALMAVASPLLLVLAAWVRLDSRGPALYLSPRIGRYGRTFRCIKFRTMHVDAEERLQRLLAADPARRAEYERWHKLDDDPRVTRAGRWLRKLSLDELAQLLNVALGHMSLVGPRPYLVRELEQMGPERDLIFLARPGITGYWQVEGRNDVTFEERQTMEAAYVRNWSVWWDLELMLRTPLAVLARRGK